MSSAMENKRKQKKTIEMNKVTTKMEIEQDYNNNDNTQSNSTINPLAIQTPTFNSKSSTWQKKIYIRALYYLY